MKKKIFIYIKDKEQLSLIHYIIKSNPSIEFGVVVEEVTTSHFLMTPVGKLNNVHFYDANKLNISILSCYGAFISTDTTIDNNSAILTAILNIFICLNVPIFDLQSSLLPASLEKISLATHYLSWHDNQRENVSIIGYPLYTKETSQSSGEYLFVLSDLNNPIYNGQDVSNFIYAVYEYARNHLGASIIWKLNNEELSNDNVVRILKNCKKFYANDSNKIVFYHSHPVISKLTTSDLVSKAKLIITTTTIPNLLDCELYNKPVALFTKPNNGNIESICKSPISSFYNAKQLENAIFDNPCRKLNSKLLVPYNNEVFLSTITNLYKIGTVTKKAYIDSLIAASILLQHKKAYGNNELNSNPYKKENERLNNKRKKHLHAIRKLVIGASIELLIIIILIICIIL